MIARLALIAVLSLPFSALPFSVLGAEVPNPMQPSASWEDMRSAVIGSDEEPTIDAAILELEAPVRADNPALVPVRITQPPGAPAITGLVVVVDENPAPVAAEFTLGESLMPLDFELRVRVESYSDVRAIATLADGRKIMAGRFVKASGGCAAPAGKSMEDLRATMGQMRFRTARDGDRNMATLMIRHPNFSGFQRDQLTLLNIPARFIQELEVTRGNDSLLTMEAGISISEDPVFRFAYDPGTDPVMVHVRDTDGQIWQEQF